ncbi:MAG TPA: hypothetical protein VLE22_07120 [Bryobacteraceae bacterium]|nr:hypothetical protein [Bryobacteraceae bacterium]
MRKRHILGVLVWVGMALLTLVPTANCMEIFGAWHCGNDYCTWSTVRNMTDFDLKNRWLIDRGDGIPSVNLVILSFVNPLKLLNDGPLNGVPVGMTQDVVNYFTSRGVRVMLSIGGITYVDYWNQALAGDAYQLGLNAATAAQRLGVGIEIDYEENSNPNLTGLQAFIDAYRSVHPYDITGTNPAARLTIDLAAGDRWLIDLTEHATRVWPTNTSPVLDYANAMVPARQPRNAADATANWQEHIDGKPQYAPPILPLAPAKFTGSLWLVTGRKPAPECVNFNNSLTKSTGSYVQTVQPNASHPEWSRGMLGYMFWAAECQGTRSLCTTPPNTCEGGMGVAATVYNIPIPMPPLRQQ